MRSHVAGLAAAMRRRGHHVGVIAAGRRTGKQGAGGRLVGPTMAFHINGSVARIVLTSAACWRIGRALRVGTFDVVHLHEPIVPMVCWMALWLRRPALAATFHANSGASRPYRVSRVLFGRLVQRVPMAIAVSEAARDCARHITDRPPIVIPNGVAPNRATTLRSEMPGNGSSSWAGTSPEGAHRPRRGARRAACSRPARRGRRRC